MLGSKDKAQLAEIRLFGNYSCGVKTQRDTWCCNSSRDVLEANIRSMIDSYNSEVERFQSEKPGSGKDIINKFINNDPKKISWTTALKADLSRGKLLEFGEGRIVPAMYRPFTREWLYFSRRLNERVYQMPQSSHMPMRRTV